MVVAFHADARVVLRPMRGNYNAYAGTESIGRKPQTFHAGLPLS